jgi:transcription initiation factor TFIID subunit 13
MEPRARAGKNRGQQNFSDQECMFHRSSLINTDYNWHSHLPVQMLLFAHGDVEQSLDSTKRVLDEILTDFIVDLCFEADRPAQLAGRQKVKLDDFKFACRKDPIKLGKIEEVFAKKAEIDAARKALDVNDDKITKNTVEALVGVEEPLGEADDDADTQTVGGKSTGTRHGK